MRWTLLLLLLLVLLFAVVAPARGAVIVTDARPSVVYEPAPTVGGPALLDGRPVWGETDRANRAHLATLDANGRRVVVGTVRPMEGDELAPVRTRVLAEGPHAVLEARVSACEGCRSGVAIWDRALLAGRTGAFRPLDVLDGWTLAGGALVTQAGAPPSVDLLDLDTGRARRSPVPGGLVGAAGTSVATRGGPRRLIVSDRDSGAERYRVESAVDPIAMGADGTLLLGGPAVASAAAPQPRPIPRPVDDDLGASPRLAGGRIAWLGTRALVITDLAGARLGGVDVHDVSGDLGFDGETAVWAERPCAVGLVVTWKVGEPAPRVPRGPCPAARIRVAKLTRRALTADLSCPATPGLGCPMVVSFGIRVRRGARTVDVPLHGPGSEALAPGERLRLRVPILPRNGRLLSRGARARVTAYARVDRHRDDARRLPRTRQTLRVR